MDKTIANTIVLATEETVNIYASNFYNTSTYKGGMALGKIGEVVAPLVSYYSTKAVMNYKASLIPSGNELAGGGNEAQNPMFGNDWDEYFRNQYGSGNVQWKPTSFQDIINNPQRLYGCTPNEIASILGDGWTLDTYDSNGQGWKFYSSKGMVFYHAGGGIHGGSYYGFSNGIDGKVKLVDENYIYTPDDKETIIPRDR